MCGIFLYIQKNGNVIKKKEIKKSFDNLKNRGPDNSKLLFKNNIYYGFHRLKIMDTSENANQPFVLNNIILICNGEIFNYKEIKEEYKIKTKSESDCEVILQLYLKLKEKETNEDKLIKKLCNILDGEFSFCLTDFETNKLYISRDPYGVRPLFYSNKSPMFNVLPFK